MTWGLNSRTCKTYFAELSTTNVDKIFKSYIDMIILKKCQPRRWFQLWGYWMDQSKQWQLLPNVFVGRFNIAIVTWETQKEANNTDCMQANTRLFLNPAEGASPNPPTLISTATSYVNKIWWGGRGLTIKGSIPPCPPHVLATHVFVEFIDQSGF